MKCSEQVSCMGGKGKCIWGFGGETWRQETFARPRHRWQDDIRI